MLCAASCSSSVAGQAHASTRLHDDFASGRPDAQWTAVRATVMRATSGNPAAWVELRADGTPAYLTAPNSVLASHHTRYTFRGRFRVPARAAGQSAGMTTVENSHGTHHDDLFVDASTGRCRVDIFCDDTALSPTRCDDGTWHTVTMIGDYGSATYTLSWQIDGIARPTVRSVGQVPATVHRLWLGDATPGKTNTTDWANVSLTLR